MTLMAPTDGVVLAMLLGTRRSQATRSPQVVFQLARVIGTSVGMIERHYGALLNGAHAGIAARLDELDQRPKPRAAART
jgi:hypothetical protein